MSGVADRYFTPDSRQSRRISRLTPTYQGSLLPPRYGAFSAFHEKAGVVKSFLRRAPYIFRSESPFVNIRSNVVENSVRPASIRTPGEPWGSVHVGVHRKGGRCYLLGDLEGS